MIWAGRWLWFVGLIGMIYEIALAARPDYAALPILMSFLAAPALLGDGWDRPARNVKPEPQPLTPMQVAALEHECWPDGLAYSTFDHPAYCSACKASTVNPQR